MDLICGTSGDAVPYRAGAMTGVRGIPAVSYTHLDVYKRQDYAVEAVIGLEHAAEYGVRHAGDDHETAEEDGNDDQVCLLYTSRCV